MKKVSENIESPALGCKVGRAYQILIGQLASALKQADLDITTNEYLVLRAVYSKEGLQQCEIADLIGKDKGLVSRCVAGLVKRGLLATEVVSYKCLRVFKTDKSRELEPIILGVAAERHHSLMNLMTQGELDIFTDLIERIINSKE